MYRFQWRWDQKIVCIREVSEEMGPENVSLRELCRCPHFWTWHLGMSSLERCLHFTLLVLIETCTYI